MTVLYGNRCAVPADHRRVIPYLFRMSDRVPSTGEQQIGTPPDGAKPWWLGFFVWLPIRILLGWFVPESWDGPIWVALFTIWWAGLIALVLGELKRSN